MSPNTRANYRNFSRLAISLPVVPATVHGSSALARSLWQGSEFFADSDLRALISVVASCYCFDVEIHGEFPGRVSISEREIVGGMVRDRDLVMKFKNWKFVSCCVCW